MACWIRRVRLPSLQRCYSASSQPLTEPIETSTPKQTAKVVPPGNVKVSKVNGYTVASLDNHAAVADVAVYVKAGSRYEPYNQRGVTHLLRNCAFFGNDELTSFGLSRSIDFIGGFYNATTTRENFIYSSRFLRSCLKPVMENLGSVATRSKFRKWEILDHQERLSLDRAQAQVDPSNIIMEGLHKVAFRNQLCNSLYCPPHQDSKLSDEELQLFVSQHFAPSSMVVVGVGVSHEELEECVQTSFSSEVGPLAVEVPEKAEYCGGELHMSSGSSFAYSAMVCKGASRSGSNVDLLAAGVLQHILGAESAGYIKWGSNSATSKLGKAGAMVTDNIFSGSAINLNYSDSGLFGINLTCAPEDSAKLMKAMMKEMNEIAKGNLSKEDMERGRKQLKARFLMNTESQDGLVEDIAGQVLTTGSYQPISNTVTAVDNITKEDVVKFANAVFGGKATYVSYGNTSTIPRLDQLLSDVFSRL